MRSASKSVSASTNTWRNTVARAEWPRYYRRSFRIEEYAPGMN
jgi:hypothetical protein